MAQVWASDFLSDRLLVPEPRLSAAKAVVLSRRQLIQSLAAF